jgi:predicted site-specific integrase-resolvase
VALRGEQVVADVTEIASGLHDERPKLKPLLTAAHVGVLVVEHPDRLRSADALWLWLHCYTLALQKWGQKAPP